jgi:serine/threonine-protein kinase
MASDRSSSAAAVPRGAGSDPGRVSGASALDSSAAAIAQTASLGHDATAVPSTALPEDVSTVHGVAPGSVLAGKYRVARVIGRGGMGLVVEALHLSLDTKVAIKLLFPEFMSYTEASERFLREARAASRLESEHVARVVDVGTLGAGEPFMVMEYLAGEDIASLLKRTKAPMPIGDAIDYIVQACDAIAEAHERGIVHRDLKPANLFITRKPSGDSFVKVLDFGISKVFGEPSQDKDAGLTQTTTILGSALYMSPEQMQSAKKVDRRTDIYALGVCLFELIGGEVPYYADSFPELCAKVYTSPPRSLHDLRTDAPEGLVRAIERALAHRVEERYASVPELVQALSPFAGPDTRKRIAAILKRWSPELALLGAGSLEREETALPLRKKRRSRAPLLLVLVLLFAGGGAGFVFRATLARQWAALRGKPPGDQLKPEPAAQTATPSAVVAPAPQPSVTAEVTPSAAPSATTVPVVASAAPSASARPSPSGVRVPGPRAIGAVAPQPAQPSPEPIKTTPAIINQDLSIESCFQTIDGVRTQVPCKH